MTTYLRILLGHKLFIVIVFYKNLLYSDNTSSSCRVVNLKVPNSLSHRNLRYGNIINFASLQDKDCFLKVLNELNMAEIPSKQLCDYHTPVHNHKQYFFHFLESTFLNINPLFTLLRLLNSFIY